MRSGTTHQLSFEDFRDAPSTRPLTAHQTHRSEDQALRLRRRWGGPTVAECGNCNRARFGLGFVGTVAGPETAATPYGLREARASVVVRELARRPEDGYR